MQEVIFHQPIDDGLPNSHIVIGMNIADEHVYKNEEGQNRINEVLAKKINDEINDTKIVHDILTEFERELKIKTTSKQNINMIVGKALIFGEAYAVAFEKVIPMQSEIKYLGYKAHDGLTVPLTYLNN